MRYITAEQVVAIHERVILSHQLQGIASERPVEAVIGRIENRIAYGLIGDIYDLAACYACYIAIGHCFHDANKRTAHTAMQVILKLNGIQLEYDIKTLGDMIIKAAQGIVEETELAAFLRRSRAKDNIHDRR